MNPLRKLSIAFATLTLLSSAAYAQDSDRQVRYKDRTVIDFDGVDVSGELVKPAGSLVAERVRARFNPLIRFRENFNEEMKQSIDEVK